MSRCCFAGHSEIYDVNVEEITRIAAVKLIEECMVREFWVGNYGQYDKLAASIVRKLKKQYTHIKLVLVIPYLTKEINENAFEYKNKYDEIIVADIQPNTPVRYRLLKANEYMIDKCEYLLAYVKHSWGGAAKTLKYAQRKQKIIINTVNN